MPEAVAGDDGATGRHSQAGGGVTGLMGARAWRRRLTLLGVLAILFLPVSNAKSPVSVPVDGASALAQAQAIRTKDHPRFLQLLQQLHLRRDSLSSIQQWNLLRLDAWEASYEGDYAKAEPLLRNVAAHAGDLDQQSLANGMLLNLLAIQHHYDEAFTLADQLAASLPKLRDQHTTFVVLSQLSQLMASAEQVEPAASYARQMERFSAPGESMCRPYVYLFGALNAKGDLLPTDPIYRRTIDTCLAAGESIYANTVQLDLATREAYLGNPRASLALLKQIAPGVMAQNYRVHVYVLRSTFGYAYWVSGDLASAKRWALEALGMDSKGDFDGLSEYVYQVLYEVENKAGHYQAALDYYRHYKNVQLRSVNDAQAVALAYHTVRQQLAIHALQVGELSKQNHVLELQQALDRKAMETSRLYLAFLLLVLISIGLWLIRIKRSQLRFQRLARRDSLTGILNHQHFVGEAEHVLQEAEKSARRACVVLMDLDHFKRINDSYGHATGDAVLIKIAEVCRTHLRSVDVFGRLGGEEFGLVLPDCSLDAGIEIIDRMRKAIAATVFDEHLIANEISASFGLTSTKHSGYVLSALMAHADAALYRAKDLGRNRVEAHTADHGGGER